MQTVVVAPGCHPRVPGPGPSGHTANPDGPTPRPAQEPPRPLPALAHVTGAVSVGRGGQAVVSTPRVNSSLTGPGSNRPTLVAIVVAIVCCCLSIVVSCLAVAVARCCCLH